VAGVGASATRRLVRIWREKERFSSAICSTMRARCVSDAL
jgi:hypothetical protein